MRIDAFLNAVNLTKKRSTAQDMIAHGAIELNGAVCKPAKEVKQGDTITIKLIKDGETVAKKYQVVEIPASKNTPKSKQSDFIKEL